MEVLSINRSTLSIVFPCVCYISCVPSSCHAVVSFVASIYSYRSITHIALGLEMEILIYISPTPEKGISSPQVTGALSSVNGYVSSDVIRGSNERLITCSFVGSQDQLVSDIKSTVEKNCSLEVFVCPCIENTSHGALVQVEGMTCNSCVRLIDSMLPTQDGVIGVNVSLANKEAFVVYNSRKTNATNISSNIYDMGFDAKVKETFSSLTKPSQETMSKPDAIKRRVDSIGIDGMTCHSCVSLIENTLGELPGVMSMRVSLECKEGVVEYNVAVVSREQIKEAIDDMGFIVTCITGECFLSVYRLLHQIYCVLAMHLFLETSVSPFGSEDAAMPLPGEIEEIGSDNKHLLPSKDKPKKESKERCCKKVGRSSWSIYVCNCLPLPRSKNQPLGRRMLRELLKMRAVSSR